MWSLENGDYYDEEFAGEDTDQTGLPATLITQFANNTPPTENPLRQGRATQDPDGCGMFDSAQFQAALNGSFKTTGAQPIITGPQGVAINRAPNSPLAVSNPPRLVESPNALFAMDIGALRQQTTLLQQNTNLEPYQQAYYSVLINLAKFCADQKFTNIKRIANLNAAFKSLLLAYRAPTNASHENLTMNILNALRTKNYRPITQEFGRMALTISFYQATEAGGIGITLEIAETQTTTNHKQFSSEPTARVVATTPETRNPTITARAYRDPGANYNGFMASIQAAYQADPEQNNKLAKAIAAYPYRTALQSTLVNIRSNNGQKTEIDLGHGFKFNVWYEDKLYKIQAV